MASTDLDVRIMQGLAQDCNNQSLRIYELEAETGALRARIIELQRMLTAAAISSGTDLVIYDGALAGVDMYETITTRDETISGLRIRVRPLP